MSKSERAKIIEAEDTARFCTAWSRLVGTGNVHLFMDVRQAADDAAGDDAGDYMQCFTDIADTVLRYAGKGGGE